MAGPVPAGVEPARRALHLAAATGPVDPACRALLQAAAIGESVPAWVGPARRGLHSAAATEPPGRASFERAWLALHRPAPATGSRQERPAQGPGQRSDCSVRPPARNCPRSPRATPRRPERRQILALGQPGTRPRVVRSRRAQPEPRPERYLPGLPEPHRLQPVRVLRARVPWARVSLALPRLAVPADRVAHKAEALAPWAAELVAATSGPVASWWAIGERPAPAAPGRAGPKVEPVVPWSALPAAWMPPAWMPPASAPADPTAELAESWREPGARPGRVDRTVVPPGATRAPAVWVVPAVWAARAAREETAARRTAERFAASGASAAPRQAGPAVLPDRSERTAGRRPGTGSGNRHTAGRSTASYHRTCNGTGYPWSSFYSGIRTGVAQGLLAIIPTTGRHFNRFFLGSVALSRRSAALGCNLRDTHVPRSDLLS